MDKSVGRTGSESVKMRTRWRVMTAWGGELGTSRGSPPTYIARIPIVLACFECSSMSSAIHSRPLAVG